MLRWSRNPWFGISLAFYFLTSTCAGLPVANWLKDTSFGGGSTATLSNANTSSPILGSGSANNADNTAIYSAVSALSLANGQRIALSGSAQLIGTSSTPDFRWGLFKNDGTGAATGGWLGFMGSAESNVWSKDPSGNNFANATFASVTEGRAVTLGQTIEPNDISFGPGTYNFGLIVERYGGELDVNVSITNEATGFSIVSPSFTEANASRQTFVFDRVGLLAGSTLDADQIRFQNMDVAVSDIARPTLEVHSSGLVVMTNPTNQAEDLTQYEIASAAGSLNPSGWASLDDGENNDPVGSGWDQAGGSSANLLAEVNLLSSETLTAGEHRSLGEAFVAGAAPDLAFHYTAAGEIRRGIVKYVQSGDFNRDGSVDAADYVLWRKSKGATVPAGSFADGDGNGQIDAADLVVFRNNFGAGDLAAVQAVTAPEPAAWIAISFLAPMFVGRMRGFHRRHRN